VRTTAVRGFLGSAGRVVSGLVTLPRPLVASGRTHWYVGGYFLGYSGAPAVMGDRFAALFAVTNDGRRGIRTDIDVGLQ
jgi:hypothetical protein